MTREEYLAQNRNADARRKMKKGNRLKIKEGESKKVRFINWPSGKFCHTVDLHHGIGPSRSSAKCSRASGQKCFFCDTCETLKKQGKEAWAKNLQAATSGVFCAVDMADPESGPQVLLLPPGCTNQLLDIDESVDAWGLGDSIVGRIVSLTCPRKGSRQSYTVKVDQQSSPITDKDWLQNLPDPDGVYRSMSYGQQRVLYEEGFDAAVAYGRLQGEQPAEENGEEEQDVTESPTDAAVNSNPPPSQSTSSLKPRCFGKSWEEGDALCVPCQYQPECSDICKAKVSAAA